MLIIEASLLFINVNACMFLLSNPSQFNEILVCLINVIISFYILEFCLYMVIDLLMINELMKVISFITHVIIIFSIQISMS